ncbi:MAG: hypothetical protein HDS68_02175 [Bacteroidales bacterium]|nr:hypothetical protein [Bacteroidales bacterium]
MKKYLIIPAFILCALSATAQEKVMNVQKADGSSNSIRVAELKNISFLAGEEGNQGMLIKRTDGKTTAVLFKSNPEVTVSDGKLIIKSSAPEQSEIEISDIAEIAFGDGSDSVGKIERNDLVCVVYDDGISLRGIPMDTEPLIYSIDGQLMATPTCRNGELNLSRLTLGSGIFIVKVGSFATKIKL